MQHETRQTKPEVLGLDVSHNPAVAEAAWRTTEMVEAAARHQFEIFEAELPNRLSHVAQLHLSRYVSLSWLHPERERLARFKSISMLHEEVLLLLRLLTMATEGPVLEIGPYVGGSTLAIGDGLKAAAPSSSRSVVSVEMGGSYVTHPQVPSKDIVTDLKSNIAKAGLEDRVILIVGNSREERVVERARDASKTEKFGLAFIDSDGNVGADWEFYEEMLRPDAFVVLDDYISEFAADKAANVKPWADKMVEQGRLRPLGVFGWGTWFGQIIPQPPSSEEITSE